MTTRQLAQQWLRQHHRRFAEDEMRSSKLYPAGLWWFTFPCDFFNRGGHLNILLQTEAGGGEFYFLRVPFSFFAENRNHLDVRGDKFDLHLSARPQNCFTDTRGGGVNFAEFLRQ